MKISSNRINKLGDVFRERRLAMGFEAEELAEELRISPKVIELVESGDWTVVPTDQEYPSIILIVRRLDLDLSAYSGAVLVDDPESEGASTNNPRTERIVMITMMVAATAMLAWLLIPAKSIVQPTSQESQEKTKHSVIWQKPVGDQLYPVLGEVFPESPITEDGVLISLRATDTCNAHIAMENGQVQNQILRMSEPWKLRVKGSFSLYLDNAGVVAVEVAGYKIQHDAGVGQKWHGSFDHAGNWLRPKPPLPVPSKAEPPDDDDDTVAEPT